MKSSSANLPRPVNLRSPEVLASVRAQVRLDYRSQIIDRLRAAGGGVTIGGLTIKLAKEFGFCYGVERAIDLAYAAATVFKGRRVFILGEIIHNPEVNEQIRALGICNILAKDAGIALEDITAQDVVIIPAFGTDATTLARLKQAGCEIVDTTCGNVMGVWKRVRLNAGEGITSIIHGKAQHEETKATASQAVLEGQGHYLVVLTLEETDTVCDYIRHGGDKAAFLRKFAGAHSEGFDPDIHLQQIGVANQTTMLQGETEEVQRRIFEAVAQRDGTEQAQQRVRFFDTICGATQERQDALQTLLKEPMDMLLVIGGYNSSNTSHLAEMGQTVLTTYFVRNAARLVSRNEIQHYNLRTRQEELTTGWLPNGPVTIGITAGASCPNNLIEETILRLFELEGIDPGELLG